MRTYLKYFRYLFRHKWFVFQAGLKTGAPLWRLIIHDWSKFLPSELIPYARKFHGPAAGDIAHKEYLAEMWPVATSAHGIGDGHNKMLLERKRRRTAQIQNERDLAFNVAWLKHQHRNPHHWQHWLLAEDNPSKRLEVPQTSGSPRAFPLPIPNHFIREMVADWMGAGRAITGRWECAEWYQKNKANLVLETTTRYMVEELLGLHAGLECHWHCRGAVSPSYCANLGGCAIHSSRFNSVDREKAVAEYPWAVAP